MCLSVNTHEFICKLHIFFFIVICCLICHRSSSSYLTSHERTLVLQNSASLRMIWEELFRSGQAIPLQTHRIRLKSYHNCFLANELVNWMIAQNKAATRYTFLSIDIVVNFSLIIANFNSRTISLTVQSHCCLSRDYDLRLTFV